MLSCGTQAAWLCTEALEPTCHNLAVCRCVQRMIRRRCEPVVSADCLSGAPVRIMPLIHWPTPALASSAPLCSLADPADSVVAGCHAGVIAAAALKCMGGSLQGRLWPRSDAERTAAEAAGYDVSKLLFIDDLCKGEQVRMHP